MLFLILRFMEGCLVANYSTIHIYPLFHQSIKASRELFCCRHSFCYVMCANRVFLCVFFRSISVASDFNRGGRSRIEPSQTDSREHLALQHIALKLRTLSLYDMGLSQSRETHFSILRKAEKVLSDPTATDSALLEAAEKCSGAIEQCPSYPMSYYIKGKLLMRLKQWREAQLLLEQCVECKEDMYSAYFYLAECLEEQDEYEQAMAVTHKVPKHLRGNIQEAMDRRKRQSQLVEYKRNSAQAHPFDVAAREPSAAEREGEGDQGCNCTNLREVCVSEDGACDKDSTRNPEGDSDAIQRKREAAFAAALKHDSNSRKYRLGQRGVYVMSAADKAKARMRWDQKARFEALSRESDRRTRGTGGQSYHLV